MLANSGATLPRGHALVETYLFEQRGHGSQLKGSLTYLLYGVTDRLTVGLKPMFGATSVAGRSSPVALGDLTLTGQYRLTSPASPPTSPSVAVSFQHSLPTGLHDRLDTRSASALGSGAHSTTIALYAQQVFRLPNGRAFRARVNLSGTAAGEAAVKSESVYGTSPGFRGRAKPGDAVSLGIAGEYSVTRNWVLAMDLVLDHAGPTLVEGVEGASREVIRTRFASATALSIAPAVEYNFTANLGVLVGTRFKLPVRGGTSSITPAIAINYVL